MPHSRSLLCCFEPPSYGGAATSAYQLFRELHREMPVDYLSLVDRRLAAVTKRRWGDDYYNPEHLPGAHEYVIDAPTFKHQAGLSELLHELNPSLVVGIGYIAAYVAKKARPDLPLILITTGCQQVKDGLSREAFETVGDLVSRDTAGPLYNDIEAKAFELADIVVTHSDLTSTLCRLYFPGYTSKFFSRVIWFYDWIHGSAARRAKASKPFESREIDLLFVASEWDRVEKNYPFVAALSERFRDRNVHVVGNTEDGLPYAVHHGLLPNHRVLDMMGDTKVLVCPSRFDAAPGVLFEGAALGCNLVASSNCGNYQLCHPDLLASRYTIDGFAECISKALERDYPSDTGHFSRQNCLQSLIELLEQCHPGSVAWAT